MRLILYFLLAVILLFAADIYSEGNMRLIERFFYYLTPLISLFPFIVIYAIVNRINSKKTNASHQIAWRLVFAYLFFPVTMILSGSAEMEQQILKMGYEPIQSRVTWFAAWAVLLSYGPYVGVASLIRFVFKKKPAKSFLLFLITILASWILVYLFTWGIAIMWNVDPMNLTLPNLFMLIAPYLILSYGDKRQYSDEPFAVSRSEEQPPIPKDAEQKKQLFEDYLSGRISAEEYNKRRF
jgi:hypothetical protein